MQALLFLLAALILFGGDLFAVAVTTSSAQPSIKPQISRHLRELPSISCQVSNTFRDQFGNTGSAGGEDATLIEPAALSINHIGTAEPQNKSISFLKSTPQKKWLVNRTILR